jgi:hypothetical protein
MRLDCRNEHGFDCRATAPVRLWHHRLGAGRPIGIGSKAMHDEDCHFGLKVSNELGQTREAFGDKRYFDKENDTNREMCIQATQASLDEISDCFKHPDAVPSPGKYKALKYVPKFSDFVLNDLDNPDENFRKNNSPLYVMWKGEVHVRDDCGDVKNYKWSRVKLYAFHGLSVAIDSEEPGFANTAIEYAKHLGRA